MEQNTQIQDGKKELMIRLGKPDSEFFVLLSACTRKFYVQCDQETFDDEAVIFFTEEEAKAAAARLAKEKVPVTTARLEQKQMLMFFTELYTMGVNALRIWTQEESCNIQIQEIVKKRDPKDMPEGAAWIENPQLHLTALYFAQELRTPAKPDRQKKLSELQEEMGADFKKASLIFAVQKEGKGTPMVKLKDEKRYQPVFTDVLEFNRFNQKEDFRPVVVKAADLANILDATADGVILNVSGVNLPLLVSRPQKTGAEADSGQKTV